MNIDLLFTEKGEAGLISSTNFVQKVVGVVFDTQSGIFTLEFADMDYLDMNIPVEESYNQYLDFNPTLHVGSITKGHIAQAYQVPLMFSDDPYRNEVQNPQSPENPLMAFNYFVQYCIAGQPVFREDLGDEDTMGCVLGDSSPSSLEFAPHLARRHAMEAQPKAAPSINAPGLGLGSGGGASGGTTQGRSAGGQNRNSSGDDDKRKK